ncbi:MAG: ABC transporter ATP-binding protein [Candidatus Bathyarchaeota archaeon]|nr:MAG: ABC transporter ATP-binding protein [Candidatus Bathyarchaeota archaeon]
MVVNDLVKNFGKVVALNGASFTVGDREIYGLIGPNGAGKTTTLRILGTLLSPTSGSAEIFGTDVEKDPDKIREIISYLPEEAGAYQNLSGFEYLEFMAGFYSDSERQIDEIIDEGVKISGLDERLDERIKGYSKGMNRRLLLARALMMRPRLAILDEPTSGLDVLHASHVRRMIKEYVDEQGVTVLLSSHNMLEVEYMCHRVALMDEGVIIAEGRPKGLIEKFGSDNLEQAFMEATRLG